MIKALRCDKSSFREIRFKPGFNVILAERVGEATDKDSRNGLGKSTLIEIIHFCLGASTKKDEGLRVKELENWTFILDVTLKGKDYSVYRNTLDFSKVKIEGDVSAWPIKPVYDRDEKKYILSVKDWNVVLGYLVFGLPIETSEKKYSPTFRSLISYFMRRGVGAFQEPFKHFPQQKEWDIQANNAFLLGLNWEYAVDFQELKDKEKAFIEFNRAERLILKDELARIEKELKSFEVHPQYGKIQEEVNGLTKEIHDIANRNTMNRQVLDKYRESVVEEKDVSIDKVEQVYREAGLVFAAGLLRKLGEVSDFHKQLIENRKEYLHSEIIRLSREIAEQESEIEKLSNKRAELMQILETHGALAEYMKLQERAGILRQRLEEIKNRSENSMLYKDGKNSIRIAKEELYQKMVRDFQDRFLQLEKALKYYNRFSKNLYSELGFLSIDLLDTGYGFQVEIKRAGSQGIGYMKVFCYDLMLVLLSSGAGRDWRSLIHDSTIFDGVDERQIAKALELAAHEAGAGDIQYICALNSDNVPYDDFSEPFKTEFGKHVIITLTDATDDGGLLGIRF